MALIEKPQTEPFWSDHIQRWKKSGPPQAAYTNPKILTLKLYYNYPPLTL